MPYTFKRLVQDDKSGRTVRLFKAARDATKFASVGNESRKVGAALRSADGTIIKGASLETTEIYEKQLVPKDPRAMIHLVCAERSVISNAVAKGHRAFEAMMVVCHPDIDKYTPCCACEAFLEEFEIETVYAVDDVLVRYEKVEPSWMDDVDYWTQIALDKKKTLPTRVQRKGFNYPREAFEKIDEQYVLRSEIETQLTDTVCQ